VLLRNEGFDANGHLRFSDVGLALNVDDIKDGRGMAVADFDNDGDLDIVINNNTGDCGLTQVPPTLLRNDLNHLERNWLAVKLIGTAANRDAIGAEVVIRCRSKDGRFFQAMRHVTAGSGYASQNSDLLHFGLGSHKHIEMLAIRWPGSRTAVQTFQDLAANQLLEIQEGRQTLRVDRVLEPPLASGADGR